VSNSQLPLAGWYADPVADGGFRWWDGTAWTAQVQSQADAQPEAGTSWASERAGTPVADHVEFAASSASSTDWEHVGWAQQSAQSTATQGTASGYVPMSPVASNPAVAYQFRGSAQTWQGWLLALSPIWSVVLLIPVFPSYITAITTQDQTDVTPLLPVVFFSLIGGALIVWLAVADGRVLRFRGYEAPWWWLLFVAMLGYFIMRIVRTGRSSVGMLVGYLLATVLSWVLAIVIAFWALSTMQPGMI